MCIFLNALGGELLTGTVDKPKEKRSNKIGPGEGVFGQDCGPPGTR